MKEDFENRKTFNFFINFTNSFFLGKLMIKIKNYKTIELLFEKFVY